MSENGNLYPAAHVLKKCGGIIAVSKIVDRDRTVVNRWQRPKSKGGTDGKVPSKYQDVLLDAFPDLTPADFFVTEPREEGAAA